MTPKIAALMSTYNGEKWLEQQITSIFRHGSDVNQLIIRDDGSSDETIDIILKLRDRFPITLIIGSKMGVIDSYLELITQVKGYDYYILADQDDIWLAGKVKSVLSALSDCSKPALYCGNVAFSREIRGQLSSELPSPKFPQSIFQNSAMGCTIAINNSLKELVPKILRPISENLVMHDWALLLLALHVGEVKFDSNAYTLYRIHENQTIGIRRSAWRLPGGKQFIKKCLLQESEITKMLINSGLRTEDSDFSKIGNSKFVNAKFSIWKCSFRDSFIEDLYIKLLLSFYSIQ